MPTNTTLTPIYSTVLIRRLPMIPTGRSRWGFLHSSALVVTASNPIYAKNTTPAPASTPVSSYQLQYSAVRTLLAKWSTRTYSVSALVRLSHRSIAKKRYSEESIGKKGGVVIVVYVRHPDEYDKYDDEDFKNNHRGIERCRLLDPSHQDECDDEYNHYLHLQ